MTIKFLFLAFCPSRTLSQPRFPQGSILAEGTLTEPGIWTVWAAAKSPSMWLPEACLVLSLPLSLPLKWPQGAVDRFTGPASLHSHGTVHLNSKLLIASSFISSIIVKSTLKKSGKYWNISNYFKDIWKHSQGIWANAVAIPHYLKLIIPMVGICCLICKYLMLSHGSCCRHLNY